MNRKPLISLFVVCTFVISTMQASATGLSKASAPQTIPSNVAKIIAEYFIRDMQTCPDNHWSEETSIANIVTMYNINGDASAYSFELNTNGQNAGYIIVSAYPDIENKILEYSDVCTPIYKNLNLVSNNRIIYTGLLNYYKQDDSNHFVDLYGDTVHKSAIPAPIETLRNDKHLPISPYVSYPITDPIEWANRYYQGPFVGTSDYKNEFENYCNFRTYSDFPEFKSACGPIAITNLMETIGSYNDYPQITNRSYQEIFNLVVNYGIQNGYYSNGGGANFSRFHAYISGSFDALSLTARTSDKVASFANIKNELNNHRPFIISLYSHSYYKNHFVFGYAYNRVQSETTGDYISFVKIADGHNSSGRYLDIASIQSSNEAILNSANIS